MAIRLVTARKALERPLNEIISRKLELIGSAKQASSYTATVTVYQRDWRAPVSLS